MLPNLSARERTILAILTVVILTAGFYLGLFKPQLETYASAREQLEAEKARLQETKAALRTGQTETEQAKQVKELLTEYTAFFDTDFRQGSALLLLSFKATDLNISITNLEPGGVLNKGYYLELPVKLSFNGSYNDVAQLLNELEALPNLTEIRSLKIANTKASGSRAADDSGPSPVPGDTLVDAVCELVIYSIPSPGEKLNLEQEINPTWQTGREDLFKTPAPVSPHPMVPFPQFNREPEQVEQAAGRVSSGPASAPGEEDIKKMPGDSPGPGAEHVF